MRRPITRTWWALALAGALVATPAASLAAAPPDDDGGSATALEEFVRLAGAKGHDLVDPACSPTATDGTLRTFTCYGLTASGLPFIARTTLGTSDVIEFEILAEPGRSLLPSTADPTAEPLPAPDDADVDTAPRFDALTYFADVFSGDLERLDAARQVTASQSPAEGYLTFQREFLTALDEMGAQSADINVYLSSDGVLICAASDNDCVTVSGIELVDGQIVNFRVGDLEIAGRLGRPGGPIPVGRTTVQLTAAYRSVSADNLTVYIRLESSSPVRFELSTAVYIDADGTQTPVDRVASLTAVDGEVKGTVTAGLSFPGADPGGTVRFLVHDDPDAAPLAAIVPVVPYGPAS
ncbi:hypothetical protein BH24ACT5_BH24ACT5_07740 [soil metagenome]